MRKKTIKASRTELGKVSIATLGGIKGTVETVGLFARGSELS